MAAWALVLAVALIAGACRSAGSGGAGNAPADPPTSDPPAGAATTTAAPPTPTTPPPAGPSETVLAAGDIASCDSEGDEKTAALLDANPGTVVTLGDNVYPSGTAQDFSRCYQPSWGRHLDRTRPSPGNHDYGTGRAGSYFSFFGGQAGPPGTGWYSYDLGAWHVVSLNSNCSLVGGCGSDSPQERWLRADLAAHPTACTLAYWHHARFSSGIHGGDTTTDGLWRALQAAGADVVLSGHDHDYERFAPLDPSGRPDAAGMRLFVVGTGGESLYPFSLPVPGSEVRHASAYGVLKLTLRATGYDWNFLAVSGADFTDTGTATCR